jgi:hypothetical protein
MTSKSSTPYIDHAAVFVNGAYVTATPDYFRVTLWESDGGEAQHGRCTFVMPIEAGEQMAAVLQRAAEDMKKAKASGYAKSAGPTFQ